MGSRLFILVRKIVLTPQFTEEKS